MSCNSFKFCSECFFCTLFFMLLVMQNCFGISSVDIVSHGRILKTINVLGFSRK